MIDLPPSLPVVTECAPAVAENWKAAEECILSLGYKRSEPQGFWTQIEIDYWGAIQQSAMPNQITVEQWKAARQAEKELYDSLETGGLQFMEPDQPFLTTDFVFGNTANPLSIKRLYVKGQTSAVVLLDEGPGATSISLFSTQPWVGFEEFWITSASVAFERTETVPVHRVEVVYPACWTDEEKIEIAKDYNDCSKGASFDLLHADQTAFEQYLGRPSQFAFSADFTIIPRNLEAQP
ncbi:hypothetical protein [Roseovarius sp. 2305UL8-3]|uniref:hypothetical protein n=1 Tax=Roseovarius conchicola TaxID=3121636 RepID=UPI00352874C7